MMMKRRFSMMSSSTTGATVTFLLLLLMIGSSYVFTTVDAAEGSSGDKCATSNQYKCPSTLCSTEEEDAFFIVDDCLDCDGHLNTDSDDNVCFDRKLLNGEDNPNPSYLWRDILGMIVWFCAAGAATACGVGGGGIYVPLGILLLNFAPKPSSGLSQASIFGASLGGLVLNIRNRHPFSSKVTTTTTGPVATKNDDGTTTTADNNSTMIMMTTTSSVPSTTGGGNDSDNDNGNGKENDHHDSTNYYQRPLIDYDMALFLAPMEMAGAVLGVLIQKILPNWLYLTLAAIILGFTSHKTFMKFFDTRDKEVQNSTAGGSTLDTTIADSTKEQQQEEHHDDDDDEETNQPNKEQNSSTTTPTEKEDGITEEELEEGNHHHRNNTTAGKRNNNNSGATTTTTTTTAPHSSNPTGKTTVTNQFTLEQVHRCEYMLRRDARQYPKEKLIGLLILWIGLILITFLKGGKGVESIIGITCTSTWYGILIVIQFLWTFGFSSVYGYKLMKDAEEKQSVGYPFHEHDVLWDFSKTRFYAFFTFIAGIVAGLIGIGGGMVLGPLMLVMGIHPRVSSATTATMIVLTSSSVAVLFVTAGLVPWQYAVTFFCICLSGAYIGKTQIDSYVKRTGKASILIFLLATIIALATVGCIIIVLTRLRANDWCFEGFNKFCNLSEDDILIDDETTATTGDRCEINRLLFVS